MGNPGWSPLQLKVLILTNDKLTRLLRDKRALIVHFSNHADMGREELFPLDLQNAVQNRRCWRLSCHAIWPGHKMELVGSVGIIFEPSVENVLKVDNCDAGSSDHGSGGKCLTIDSFYQSFQVPIGKYNEWWIVGAEVKGIFVSNPKHILTRKVVPIIIDGQEHGQTTNAEPTTLDEIFSAFPEFSVFTMGPAGPEVLRRQSSWDTFATVP